MEATISSGWIYDQLLPPAEQLKMAYPLMLRAIHPLLWSHGKAITHFVL